MAKKIDEKNFSLNSYIRQATHVAICEKVIPHLQFVLEGLRLGVNSPRRERRKSTLYLRLKKPKKF